MEEEAGYLLWPPVGCLEAPILEPVSRGCCKQVTGFLPACQSDRLGGRAWGVDEPSIRKVVSLSLSLSLYARMQSAHHGTGRRSVPGSPD